MAASRSTSGTRTGRASSRAQRTPDPPRGVSVPTSNADPPAKVKPNGPSVGRAISTRPAITTLRELHPLIGNVTVDSAQGIILQALLGRPRFLMDAYDDMRDRCPRLDAVCGTRILAIQGRPWNVLPPEGYETDRDSIAIARKLTTIVRQIPKWKSVVGNLADGILRGHSVNQNVWGLTRDGYHAPVAVEWIHPNRIALDADLRWTICEWNNAWPGTPLESFGPNRFMVHSPTAGRAAYPTRRGLLLSCLMYSLIERYGIRWWLRGAERWGQPQAYALVPEGSEGMLEQAKIMLRALGDDWQAAFAGNIDIKTIDQSGTFSGEGHEKLIKLIYTTYSIRMLGHNLMAEVEGGSFAAAQTGNFVREDLLAADLEELDDTITQQLVHPIQEYNWPGSAPCIYRTQREQMQPLTSQDMGVGAFSIDDFRASKGWDALPGGAGTTRPTAPATVMMAPVAAPTGSAPLPGLTSDASGVTTGAGGAPTSVGGDVSKAGLTGPQIASVTAIVQQYIAGTMPRDVAVALTCATTPIDKPTAETLFDPTSVTGAQPMPAQPKPSAATITPPGGAAAAAPFAKALRATLRT